MSRRSATCFRSLLPLSLAAIALAGCGSGKHDAPAPQAVAAAAPAEEPPPTPPTSTPAPAPAAAAPVEAPPVTPATAAPESLPSNPPSPAPAPEASPKPQQQQPDALQWMRDSEARRFDYERRMAEAQTNIESANLSMVTWERNVLAFKNPYLARPQLSPEDTQAIAGMNGTERVRWAEGRLSEVSAKRDAAQKTLDDLKKNPPQN